MEIRMITKAEADGIIATREPRGLFYLDTGKSFVGIDNSTGYAWTEEFDTLPKCRAWLLQEPDSGPEPRTYVVTEQCSNCEREVEIHGWDTAIRRSVHTAARYSCSAMSASTVNSASPVILI